MPEQVTEHEYDDTGRPSRSRTVTEPLYTEADRAELLALANYRRTLCPNCGGPLDECTAPEKTGPRFSASWIRCQRTDAVMVVQESLKEKPRTGALIWSATETGR